jgi:hypothetical protein
MDPIKNWLDVVVASRPMAAGLAGLYTFTVYLVLSHMLSFNFLWKSYPKTVSSVAAFAVVLFWFGYMKHEIGYYMTIESHYCDQTTACREEAKRVTKDPSQHVFQKLRASVGFLQNVWLEAIGEGILYILLGFPIFALVENPWVAAFALGVLSHLVASFSGFHRYFCRSTCKSILL